MRKSEIVAAIERNLGTSGYAILRIGITNDPEERRRYWRETERQNTTYWSQWQSDSLLDAQEIESHFINDKGMKGGTGGDMSPYRVAYVYVF
jgi:hypothetical protein